ncbi:MAG TPA: hypothetical protein VM056_01795 [Terriglobales bacterium]|nr:hypothetical protein [Terriglobales bacterium]
MKLGADNPVKIGIMAVLLIGAVYILVQMFSGGSAPVTSTANSANKSPQATRAAQRDARLKVRPRLQTLTPSLDPTLRFDLLRASEDREYEGGKRNIFKMFEEVVVAKIDKPIVPPYVPPVDPGPPPPPPINLKFFGFANKPGEPKKIFLSSGDDVLIGGEGDIVNRRYKIIKISASSVEIEDVLNNNRQTIPLT